jgi:hypothetical protein
MNRVEFQKWLDQFPEDTIIEVGLQEEAPAYGAYGAVHFHEFHQYDEDECIHDECGTFFEYTDFTQNRFVVRDPTHPAYGKKILRIGTSV